MLTIIHGDDVVSSRNYFLEQKNKDSITFDAESLSLIELGQSVQGSGLFGPSNKVFIENLFSRKGLKNLETIAEIINKTKEANVFIWADKEIGVKNLSSFPKIQNQIFKIPQNIWAFLDGIKPRNQSNLTMFQNVLKTTSVEIVFTMIVRQFRLMLGLIEISKENIDEVKRLAPWQRGKLTKQASMFGIENLKKTYKKLYKIDKSQKTGSSNLNLTQSIDILLLEI